MLARWKRWWRLAGLMGSVALVCVGSALADDNAASCGSASRIEAAEARAEAARRSDRAGWTEALFELAALRCAPSERDLAGCERALDALREAAASGEGVGEDEQALVRALAAWADGRHAELRGADHAAVEAFARCERHAAASSGGLGRRLIVECAFLGGANRVSVGDRAGVHAALARIAALSTAPDAPPTWEALRMMLGGLDAFWFEGAHAARSWFERAVVLAELADGVEGCAPVSLSLALSIVELRTGQAARAVALLEQVRARSGLGPVGDAGDLTRAWSLFGDVCDGVGGESSLELRATALLDCWRAHTREAREASEGPSFSLLSALRSHSVEAAAQHHLGEAIELGREALSVSVQLGLAPQWVAAARATLATPLLSAGRYDEALHLLDVAIEEARAAGDSVAVGEWLYNRAEAKRSVGNVEGATADARERWALARSQWGEGSAVAVIAGSELAGWLPPYEPEVEELHQAALDLLPGLPGRELELATARWRMATLRMERGEAEQALLLLEQAQGELQELLPYPHPRWALHDETVGRALALAGRMSEAVPHLERALGGYERTIGGEHPAALAVRVLLAGAAWQQGDRQRAGEVVDAALEAVAARSHIVAGLPPSEALGYAVTVEQHLAAWLWVHDDAPSREAWARVLRFHGVASRLLSARVRLGLEQPDAARQHAVRAVELARAGLAATTVGRGALDASPDPGVIAWLSSELIAAERRLAALTGGADGRADPPTPTQICAGLPAGVRLVQFARTQLGGERRYLAFLTDAACEVARVDLGDAPALERAIEAWTSRLAARADPLDTAAVGQVVLQRLWEPLSEHILAGEALRIVPAGALHAVPWAALPVGDGRFMVELHEISVGSSADVWLRAAHPPGVGLLTVAGVPPSRGQVATQRGTSCAPAVLPALPGSLQESASVARAWRRYARGPSASPSIALHGLAATPSAVRRAAEGAEVLHVATHSYRVDARCACGSPEVYEAHPMLGVGLELAPEGGVGRLPAELLTAWDLRTVALVLLSACETAAGVARPWEGVQGLQRAFDLAGARQSVASLWRVDDAATASLMAGVLRSYLADPERSAERALRAAQLDALTTARARGQHGASEWGAWLVSGG
jgi:CHAT domain-containing protein